MFSFSLAKCLFNDNNNNNNNKKATKQIDHHHHLVATQFVFVSVILSVCLSTVSSYACTLLYTASMLPILA